MLSEFIQVILFITNLEQLLNDCENIFNIYESVFITGDSMVVNDCQCTLCQ